VKCVVLLLLSAVAYGQSAAGLPAQLQQVLVYREAYPLALDGAWKEARLLLEMQRPLQARQVLEEACNAHPGSLECLAFEAEICERLNQIEDAKELLTRCTRLAPDDPRVWKWLGDLELRRKDPAAAAAFGKAADLRPNDAQAWAGMAAAEQEAGRNAKARLHFEKAAALNVDCKRPNAMVYLLYGDYFRESGEWRRGIDQYTSALALDRSLGGAYLGRGRCRMELGEYEAARQDLTRCEREPALRLEAINLLFKIYKAERNTDQAQRYAREIQKLSDEKMKRDATANEVASALAHGAELLGQGQINEAEKVYEALAREHPEAATAYEGIARAFAQAGHYSEAERAIRTYLSSVSEDAAGHVLLGKILLNEHRAAEAEPEFRSAERLDPMLVEAQVGDAACQIVSGKYSRAVETLRRAVSLPSASESSRLMLSEALYKSGKPDAARKELEQVLQSDPSNGRALQMKQAIEQGGALPKP